MNPRRPPARRPLAALVAGAALVLLAACGVSSRSDVSAGPGPGATPTTEAPAGGSTGTPTTEGGAGSSGVSIPPGAKDRMVDAYEAMGLDEEQASCLADKIAAQLGGGQQLDLTEAQKFFAMCDISMSDLGLGGGQRIEDRLVKMYQRLGMTKAQAECVAQKVIADVGGGATSLGAGDAAKYFRACGFTRGG